MVKASMGHIRELTNEGEDSLGFEMAAQQVSCQYAPRDARAKKTIAGLRQAVKQADTVYIATDPRSRRGNYRLALTAGAKAKESVSRGV